MLWRHPEEQTYFSSCPLAIRVGKRMFEPLSPSPNFSAPAARVQWQGKERAIMWFDSLNRQILQLVRKHITEQRNKKKLKLHTCLFEHCILWPWAAAFFIPSITFQTITYPIKCIITTVTTNKFFDACNLELSTIFFFSLVPMCAGVFWAFETGEGRGSSYMVGLSVVFTLIFLSAGCFVLGCNSNS